MIKWEDHQHTPPNLTSLGATLQYDTDRKIELLRGMYYSVQPLVMMYLVKFNRYPTQREMRQCKIIFGKTLSWRERANVIECLINPAFLDKLPEKRQNRFLPNL